MRRKTGAILIETRPATIMTSAWRGLARKTSAPKRATSLRASVIAIISIAQQANPKVAGQIEDLRPQLTKSSSRVVITSGRTSPIFVSRPIFFDFQISNLRLAPIPLKHPLFPHINVSHQQNSNENHHFEEDKGAGMGDFRIINQRSEGDSPREEKNRFYVE